MLSDKHASSDNTPHRCVAESQLNLRNVACRAPAFRDERLASDIVIEQVQCLIDQLLLRHDVLPARDALGNAHKRSPAVCTSVVKDDLKVLEATRNLAHSIRTLIDVDVNGIYGGTHRLRDFANLGQQ